MMTRKEKIWMTIIAIVLITAFVMRAKYAIKTGEPMFDNIREVRIVK